MKKILALLLSVLMLVGVMPMSVFAAEFDTSISQDYFTVISEDKYNLAPGATETELILNNADGNDRKVVHYFEVDPKNENIEVLPGYYGIDKLDPDNLPLNGVADKTKFWKAEQLTKTVAYYEGLGYNVVGAMNTALAYDSDAPYGYMVMNGIVLGTPEVHKGAQTYLAIDGDGNCELRSMTTPLKGNEVTAISANFGWLVKDGVLTSKTVERTSSDASRSMIGIKADGTLVFCQVDGRNAPFSTGLSNYEMGEMMLSLGCVNAVNCDGGGSSTFVSKREGETVNTMRSVPSDGSERATINSVILVSKAKPTGEFDHAVLDADYDYYAPGTSATMKITGVDASGAPAELPAEGITWALSDDSFGTASNGVFRSTGKKGDVTVKMLYNGELVGEKLIHVVDPDVFALALDETVLPYGKTMAIDFACTYGADSWPVCVEGAYKLVCSNTAFVGMLEGNVLKAPGEESGATGVDITAVYLPNETVRDVLKVTYGKGSEIIYDFEDGDTAGFVNFDDAKKWSEENGVSNTLVGSDPLAGQFSEQVRSDVFVSESVVRNGKYALAWSIDNTDAGFAGWTYNVIFNIGETIVLRDVANGKNATTLGMWLYIP
ncbi:MAG: phosphodiester glycosidase family protein, partial [Clostridia bacterium]|nr:phosphodiester glycosidase family protein [Clostridia bacterium]